MKTTTGAGKNRSLNIPVKMQTDSLTTHPKKTSISVLKTMLAGILVHLTVVSNGQATAKLDTLLNLMSEKGMAMGSLAISKDGKPWYKKSMGYARIDSTSRTMATSSTVYRIGSASKMFTAVMILQLVEEKKTALSQKLSAYFPELPNAASITIKQMLYHRSGLHDYTHNTNFEEWMTRPTSKSALLAIIKEKGSDFPPDSVADYSNSNFLLLGYIIEKITHRSYAAELKYRIIDRLHLRETYTSSDGHEKTNESESYKYANNEWLPQKQTYGNLHGGAGSILSTATDLVTFIDALFAGKLISAKTVRTMTTLIDDYGMGIFANKYGKEPSFGHNGRIEEFYTAVWHFPTKKLSIAYCTNGINYPRADLMENILKICFGEHTVLPFTDSTCTAAELQTLTGRYRNDQIEVNCQSTDGKLFIETRGKLFATSKLGINYYWNKESGYYFAFNPANKTLDIKETDNTYHLQKIADKTSQ